MKKIVHHALTGLAYLFAPFVWLSLRICGDHFTLREYYRSLHTYRKSGQAWGPFDEGWTQKAKKELEP